MKDALSLAPITIWQYLDKHPEYTDSSIEHAIMEARFVSSSPAELKLDWKPDFIQDDKIDIEPVRKGRRLKSLREIIRQVFKK